jgi:chromosome segregation ATPase
MSESIAGGDMAGDRGAGSVTIPAYLLEDSPRLAKRLETLQAAEERAKEAIALIGEASEIAQLRAQAAAERDEQDRLTAETRKECDDLLAAAKAEAGRVVELARETSQDMLTAAEKTLAAADMARSEAQGDVAEAGSIRQELAARETALDSERTRLQHLEDEVVQTQQQLLQEKSELASVREQINTILG